MTTRRGGRAVLRRAHPWRRPGLAGFAIAALVLAVLASNRTGPQASVAAAAPARASTVAASVVTFAAVGDSITNADSEGFAELRVGAASWVSHAVGPDLTFVGGWARGGATTSDMARNARPVAADVLVVIAGTNDLAHGVAFGTVSRNLVTVVETVGAAHVVVSAIPPRDSAPAAAAAFNRLLEPFVVAQGWTFVDAMAGLRDGDLFARGMSDDGLHPSRRGAVSIGGALATVILGLGGVTSP